MVEDQSHVWRYGKADIISVIGSTENDERDDSGDDYATEVNGRITNGRWNEPESKPNPRGA